MYKIGWFSTGRDKAARDLLKTAYHGIKSGDIAADIAFVFSNRDTGEYPESDKFFALVKKYGLPLAQLSSRRFKSAGGEYLSELWRLDYDRRVLESLKGYTADICLLAGYMLIVGPEMCRRYNMINLHPAAPGGPQGTWQDVIWSLIEGGARETGVMMHLVTPELDKGPVATYCTFPIRGKPFDKYWKSIKGRCIADIKSTEGERNQLFSLIRECGLAREFPLIIRTIKAFSEGRIRIERGKVLSASGDIITGYDLTPEINQDVKGALDEIYLLRS